MLVKLVSGRLDNFPTTTAISNFAIFSNIVEIIHVVFHEIAVCKYNFISRHKSCFVHFNKFFQMDYS
jgi:hypothetical protein